MPPSASLRAQTPSPESMPRESIGNADPRRQTFKNERPVAMTGLSHDAPTTRQARPKAAASSRVAIGKEAAQATEEAIGPGATTRADTATGAIAGLHSRCRGTIAAAAGKELLAARSSASARNRASSPPEFAGIPDVSPCCRALHEDA
ncbi:hypothetical protein PP715_08420 [Ralstonia solanacearum]|nr:hypothetical protein [Ralstonia solanacearum]MDC6317648.1 hypothetical protein [Ralstonia solanacearum]QJC23671.1 hypothetical protein G8D25_05640 [Ralstonia solanacearum]